jgi:uncharacterized lipoprotein
MKRVGVSFLFLTALLGCGTHAYQEYGVYDRSNLYLESELLEPIHLPEDMDATPTSDRYAIPRLSEVDMSMPPVSLAPPEFDVLPEEK